MEIKAIIFDYGGTLDTGGRHWSEVLWEAYLKEEIPVQGSDFRDAYVYAERKMEAQRLIAPTDTFLQVLRTKADLQTQFLLENGLWDTGELTRRADAEHIALDCYAQAQAHTAVSRPIVRRLSQQYPLALVSNFYGNLHTVIKDFGLNHFRLVVESAAIGIRKPNPQIFQHAIHALDCIPSEVVVVGDSLQNDIMPAKALGCRTIWLSRGTGSRNASASATINQLSELEAELDHLSDIRHA